MRISDWSSDVCSSDLVGTIVEVTDHGAIPDDGLDDTKAVLRALAAANAVKGKVTLRFPKGRTQITEVLRIARSDIVLDGAGDGPGGSELWFPRPLKLIDQSHDYDELREYLVREKKQQVEPEHNIDYLSTESRSEERRVGKESVSTGRSRGWTYK